jgi:hypothetical protein
VLLQKPATGRRRGKDRSPRALEEQLEKDELMSLKLKAAPSAAPLLAVGAASAQGSTSAPGHARYGYALFGILAGARKTPKGKVVRANSSEEGR